MGLENREYLRDGPSFEGSYRGSYGGSYGRSGGSDFFRTAVGILLTLNVAVFLLEFLGAPLSHWLELPATFQVVGSQETDLHDPLPMRGEPAKVKLPPGAYVRHELSGDGVIFRVRRSAPGDVEDLIGKLDPQFLMRPYLYAEVKFAFPIDDSKKRGGFHVGKGVLEVDRLSNIAWQLPWRLVTYGFCHDKSSLFHILFNMLWLFFFGRLIEGIYGRREFLWLFLVGVLVSGLCHLALEFCLQLVDMGDEVPMVGASGGVMTVMVIAAMHFPREKVLFMLIFPIELGILVIGCVLIDVIGLLDNGSNTAHAAHLGGAAFGFFYKRRGWKLSEAWGRLAGVVGFWKKRVARPKVKLHRQPVDGLDDQLDAVLEKISRSGEKSLNEREREVLMEASRRKRQRR